jgi:3',5'-cyclic AMP phosphodiesterase CpdA
VRLSRREFLLSIAAGAAGWRAPLLRAAASPLFHFPYLQDVGSDHAAILWAARESVAGSIELGTEEGAATTVLASRREFPPSETGIETFYRYEARLERLALDTRYLYRVLSNGRAVTDSIGFRTAAPGPFDFLVFGDSGQATAAQSEVSKRMMEEAPDLILHTGDIVYPTGSFEQFEHVFFPYYSALLSSVPLFPAPGNHDYLTDQAHPYLGAFSVPAARVAAEDRGRYYSFDWGNVHFVSLDSNTPLTEAAAGEGPMLEWLDDDLRESRKFWRIVFFHHPPYVSTFEDLDLQPIRARAHIVPILERHGVEIVFNGHHHSYQRSQFILKGQFVTPETGTVYITTGGGGAILRAFELAPVTAFGESTHHYMRVSVEGAKLTARAIRSDGREIDTFSLAPLPAISGTAVASLTTSGILPEGKTVVTISGRRLAAEEIEALATLAPTELAGTTVRLDGRPLGLLSVSSTRIRAQLRATGRGPATLSVTTPNGSAQTTIQL